MTRGLLTLIALTLLILFAGESTRSQTVDGQLSLSFLVTTDYKRAGLSQTESEPAARFSVDYEHASGFFAGGFAANVKFAADRRFDNRRDFQANLYAGYVWRGSDWTTNVSVSRYIYPDIRFRYDYTHTAINASFRNRYLFSVAHSDNSLSLNRSAYEYRAGIAMPWVLDLEFGLNAGRFRSTELFNTAYSFWDVGVSRVLKRFALDLRYHDNTYEGASILGESGDDRWVFSVAYAINARSRNPR